MEYDTKKRKTNKANIVRTCDVDDMIWWYYALCVSQSTNQIPDKSPVRMMCSLEVFQLFCAFTYVPVLPIPPPLFATCCCRMVIKSTLESCVEERQTTKSIVLLNSFAKSLTNHFIIQSGWLELHPKYDRTEAESWPMPILTLSESQVTIANLLRNGDIKIYWNCAATTREEVSFPRPLHAHKLPTSVSYSFTLPRQYILITC